jgi:hypothetical protein
VRRRVRDSAPGLASNGLERLADQRGGIIRGRGLTSRVPLLGLTTASARTFAGALSGGMASIASGGHGVQPPASPPGAQDPRTSSIQALRMRAKEHVESLSKGLQHGVRASPSQPGRDEAFVSVS